MLRWGILGGSRFAAQHMGPAIHAAKGNVLAALATSDAEKSAPFQEFNPDIAVVDDYENLLNSDMIDAVYVPLPNHLHIPWTLKALDAGKHVLCEKPMALRAEDFEAVIEKRNLTKLHVAEALMIAHHPQMTRAQELLRDGAIGALRHVDAVFSFNNAGDEANIRHDPSKGGGGLYDIGVYTCAATRFITGAEPKSIDFAERENEHGVDIYARFAASFPNFKMSSMVSMRLFNRQFITFHGDKGVLTLKCPFNSNVFDFAELTVESSTAARVHERWPSTNHYVLQVENFAQTVKNGTAYPCPLEFSHGTQKMLDMIFEASGGHPVDP